MKIKKLNEETKSKRIACTTEFDNGHVIHNDWKTLSNDEAEELARQKSVDNPGKVYYVQYDDIMNPSSDIKWKNGQKLNEETQSGYKKGDRVQLSTGETAIVTKDYQVDEDRVEVEIEGMGKKKYIFPDLLLPINESKPIKVFGAKAKKLNEAEEVLYVIKDSHGNQLSRPTADDGELWDRVASMEARGRRGLRVVAYVDKSEGPYIKLSDPQAYIDELDFAGAVEIKGDRVYADEETLRQLANAILAEYGWEVNINEGLNEASYGGAFDIADDQYFTKEELVEFGEDVVDNLNSLAYSKAELESIFIENNVIEITITWDGNEITVEQPIDMRRIRTPKDLDKYRVPVISKMKPELEELGFDFGPHLRYDESIDGWDNRTGVIKRIADYLYDNPKATPPKGYIPRFSRAYDDAASIYGDYVTTSFGNISTDDLMQYARDNKLITEAYEGVYSDKFRALANKYHEDAPTEDALLVLINDIIRYCPEDDLKDLWVKYSKRYEKDLEESLDTDTAPAEDINAGMSSVISSLIKDEYEAIDGYNSAIATALAEGHTDVANVLVEIQAEENVHVGQLQEVMKMFDPNADKIEDGVAEAEEQLSNPLS